ncbi:unnamed protein product [Symbiodinium sp. KB8]|nr:unnamed protein product [Symbiodinium sp. KB8]
MVTCFGDGLEIFLPKKPLQPGDAFELDPASVDERPMLTCVPDQEALPFKALHALSFNCRLRCFTEPEALHASWNDARNAIKRAELQPALLLGSVMSQAAHGPFNSGHNQFSREQIAELMAETLGAGDFECLKEAMLMDRCGEDGAEIPQAAADLTDLSLMIMTGKDGDIQAKNKTWFESIVAIYRIALNWSLESAILSKLLSMGDGLDEEDGQEQAPAVSDEEAADSPAEAAAGRAARPKTKKELGEVQSTFRNKLELAHHYYEDDLLRLEMKVIFWGTYHVMKEFSETLKQHKQGQIATLRWRAERACGGWFKAVSQTLLMLHDSSVLEKLHLTLAEADDSSIPPEEEITLERFYSYVLELASARSWSQSLYSTCLPNFFAGIFHEKQALRDTCMTRVKELWKCVLEAEAFVRNPREDAAVRQAVAGILADMAWNRLQISRELLAVIRQGQYDTSDYETNEFQWPELQPAFEDFAQATSSGSADAMQSTASGKVFLVPKDFQMPPELNFTASNLSKIGRKAGALSNYESAAATAWVKHNAHNSFACAPLAWSGHYFAWLRPLLLKEFLVIADHASSTTWMINGTVDAENTWKLIPAKPLLPCMVPAGLRQFASLWLVTGAPQPMIKAAVAEGCFLTAANLKKLKSLLGFPVPKKAKDRKAHDKEAYCRAFLKFLWPEASEEKFEEMVKNTMGGVKRTVRCPREVLAAVEELAKNEQRDFEHLRDAARNQCKVEEEARKLRSDAGTPAAGERKTFTPESLQQLLPQGVVGCFLHRNPLIKRYQAGYPGDVPGFGKTLAATWGGPLRGLSEFQALRECLIDFVWAKHMPTDDMIQHILNSFDANTGLLTPPPSQDAPAAEPSAPSRPVTGMPKASSEACGANASAPKSTAKSKGRQPSATPQGKQPAAKRRKG